MILSFKLHIKVPFWSLPLKDREFIKVLSIIEHRDIYKKLQTKRLTSNSVFLLYGDFLSILKIYEEPTNRSSNGTYHNIF